MSPLAREPAAEVADLSKPDSADAGTVADPDREAPESEQRRGVLDEARSIEPWTVMVRTLAGEPPAPPHSATPGRLYPKPCPDSDPLAEAWDRENVRASELALAEKLLEKLPHSAARDVLILRLQCDMEQAHRLIGVAQAGRGAAP